MSEKHTVEPLSFKVDSCGECRKKETAEYRVEHLKQGYHGQFADKEQVARVCASWNTLRNVPLADLEAGAVEKLVKAARSSVAHDGCTCNPNYITPYVCSRCKLRAALKPFAGMKGGA